MPQKPLIHLDETSPPVIHLIKSDPDLARVIRLIGPLEYRPYPSSGRYAFLVHEIIEQMLSVKAGSRIYGRLEELCGGRISPSAISRLTEEQIRGIGTSAAKARYIIGLTQAVRKRDLVLGDFDSLDDAEVTRRLQKLHGVGSWTAKMFLIFCLNRQDVLPFEDVAFLQGLSWTYGHEIRIKDEVLDICRNWHPYASIGARYMYEALDSGLTRGVK